MNRIKPIQTEDAQKYWEACAEHRFVLQHCHACNHIQFPPRAVCSKCGSRDISMELASRKGTVYSCTTIYRAPVDAYKPSVPYVVAQIDLDEGPRLMSNIVGEGCLDAAIGDRVAVEFDDDGPVTVPVFHLDR